MTTEPSQPAANTPPVATTADAGKADGSAGKPGAGQTPPAPDRCSLCSGQVTKAHKEAGQAVRVSGNWVCPMCIDTLPASAQVRINQMRALRGLQATVYRYRFPKHPQLGAYTYTTSAALMNHYRTLHAGKQLIAPLIAPPISSAVPNSPPSPEHQEPVQQHLLSRTLVFGSAGLVAILLLLLVMVSAVDISGDQHSAEVEPVSEVEASAALADDLTSDPASAQQSDDQIAAPAAQRTDYPDDPWEAWTSASLELQLTDPVLVGIARELAASRNAELDLVANEIVAGRLASAQAIWERRQAPRHPLLRRLELREERVQGTLQAAVASANQPSASQPPVARSSPDQQSTNTLHDSTDLPAQAETDDQIIDPNDAIAANDAPKRPTSGDSVAEAKISAVAQPESSTDSDQEPSAPTITIPPAWIATPLDFITDSAALPPDWHSTTSGMLSSQTESAVLSRPIQVGAGSYHCYLALGAGTTAGTDVRLRIGGNLIALPEHIPARIASATTPESADQTEAAAPTWFQLTQQPLYLPDRSTVCEIVLIRGQVEIAGLAIQPIPDEVGATVSFDLPAPALGQPAGSDVSSTIDQESTPAPSGFHLPDLPLALDSSTMPWVTFADSPDLQLYQNVFLEGIGDHQIKHAFVYTDYVPAGMPGNAGPLVLASAPVEEQQQLQINLGMVDISTGGLVLLLHPSTHPKRTQLQLACVDFNGDRANLPLLPVDTGSWQTLVVNSVLLAGAQIDTTKIMSLIIEDVQANISIPFMVSKLVVSSTPPHGAMLELRERALRPLTEKATAQLLDAVTTARKRSADWRTDFDPSDYRVLVGHHLFTDNWRRDFYQELGNHTGSDTRRGTAKILVMHDPWLNDEFIVPEDLLDLEYQVAVVATAGIEFPIGLDGQQALLNFWDKMIVESLQSGILPVVVLGPTKANENHRDLVEHLWTQIDSLLAERHIGVPLIDLRSVGPSADSHHFKPGQARLSAALLAEAIAELRARLQSMQVAAQKRP